MKLKVPIERKDLDVSVEGLPTWNDCLYEISQLEVCFDEDSFVQQIEDNFSKIGCTILPSRAIKFVKNLIAAMPEILTIKKGE